MKELISLDSASQLSSRPTILSLGMVVISLRAEIRVRAPSFRMNSCSWERLLVAKMSSSRKSEKKYPFEICWLKETNIDSRSVAPPIRYLQML